MSTIVAYGLTAEQFRANDAHRNALKAFLETPTGAELLHVLKLYGRPSPVSGFPADKLIELRAAAHIRSESIFDAVDHILDLVKPIRQSAPAQSPRRLEDRNVPDEELPPPFTFEKPETK